MQTTEMKLEIPVKKIAASKLQSVDFSKLQFGKITSDHMFMAKYADKHWHDAQILPYSNISLAPDALCFHYGQTIFEGMKAFRMQDGRISIFRIEKHFERINVSLERMCMAPLDEELFYESIKQLIALDRQWVPESEGTSLYIRPFMIATEERFGVKESDEYLYIVFSGPVPQLFHQPVKVKVETNFVRAAKGGTGYAKCGGNYGAAFYPTKIAREEGYNAVLWTDSRENKYIEESGTMNVMFMINDVLVTPPLSDSILDGVTRDSVLTIARDMGIQVEERLISVDELIGSTEDGSLSEAFVTGTAAVVAPMELISAYGTDHTLPSISDNAIMFQLKNKLDNIRRGTDPDIYGWNTIV